MKTKQQNILIVAATSFEIAATVAYLETNWDNVSENKYQYKNICVEVIYTGVGMTATALQLGMLMAKNSFDFALQLGIAGLYPTDKARLGDIFWIKKDLIADLGAMDANGTFLDLVALGLAKPNTTIFENNVASSYFETILKLKDAVGATVNCISGDPNVIINLPYEKESIILESMEGASFHMACLAHQIPYAQIRTISNWVALRDKSQWKIQLAIEQLNLWAKKWLSSIIEESHLKS